MHLAVYRDRDVVSKLARSRDRRGEAQLFPLRDRHRRRRNRHGEGTVENVSALEQAIELGATRDGERCEEQESGERFHLGERLFAVALVGKRRRP